MGRPELEALAGSLWVGEGELWLDPLGNELTPYECTLRVEKEAVHYTWVYEGKEKQGSLTWTPEGARWVDSWHQPEGADCEQREGGWALADLWSTYPAGDGPPWGWRTILAQRPGGELVLQMVNRTPWGEEGRAVRMVFTRQP